MAGDLRQIAAAIAQLRHAMTEAGVEDFEIQLTRWQDRDQLRQLATGTDFIQTRLLHAPRDFDELAGIRIYPPRRSGNNSPTA